LSHKRIFAGMGSACLEHGVRFVGWPACLPFPNIGINDKWNSVRTKPTQQLLDFLWVDVNRQNMRVEPWTDGK
jgi:hypothetical protein